MSGSTAEPWLVIRPCELVGESEGTVIDGHYWNLSFAFLAGFALGAFYFGGLWWTVQSLPGARRPGLLVAGSFVARTLVVCLGFFLVMDGDWKRVIACLLGFVLMRIALMRRLQPKSPPIVMKANHESDAG